MCLVNQVDSCPTFIAELNGLLHVGLYANKLNYYRLCTPKAAHSKYHLLKFLKDSKKNDKTVSHGMKLLKKSLNSVEKLAKISMLTFPRLYLSSTRFLFP